MERRLIANDVASFGIAVASLCLVIPSAATGADQSSSQPRSSTRFAHRVDPPQRGVVPWTFSDSTLSDSYAAADPDSASESLSDSMVTESTDDLIAELESDRLDSARVHIELGASSDLTNEQFYETDYTDPNFRKRTLISNPESRMAGVWLTSVTGTRAHRSIAYQLQNQLSLGDKVRQGWLSGLWRHELDPSWRYQLIPRLEYRSDRTFDRELEEWRATLGTRLRRLIVERGWTAELGTNAEILRSSGYGSDLVLDRQLGELSLSVDRLSLTQTDLHLGYRLALRAFPDSMTRDHWEHGWEGRWKRTFLAGHSLALETGGARRQTRRIVTTSRDNFWELEGGLEGELRWSDAGSFRARVAAEAMKYDLEDDLLYFNYQIVRARLGPRLERGSMALTLGPRAEVLVARRSPSEQYRDIGGAFEFEYLGARTWWSVTPAAGWRDYSEPSAVDSLSIGLHSSFAFYEIAVIADQALSGALRVRLFGNARYESHVDSAQDARSLYFSLDVRRLF